MPPKKKTPEVKPEAAPEPVAEPVAPKAEAVLTVTNGIENVCPELSVPQPRIGFTGIDPKTLIPCLGKQCAKYKNCQR